MRYLVLFLLLTSAALALDTKRVGTHYIDENLTDTVSFVDYSYGSYANATELLIKSYSNELDYIKTRSGPTIISRWSITYYNDSIAINVTGTYPDFVTIVNDTYKIDGKGFIDTLCKDYPASYMPKISQEFDFNIVVPDSLAIISVPNNDSADLRDIVYNLTVAVSGNIVTRNATLVVKNDTGIIDYCNEREGLDRTLKVGIIAVDKDRLYESAVSPYDSRLVWIVGILALLLLSLYYLVRK
jgi:hypothetical protein